MPKLIHGRFYPMGDQHMEVSQETTGEVMVSMKGSHGDTLTTVSVDHDGNLMDYTGLGLLEQILSELRKFNVQLSMITDHEIKENDVQ